MKLKTKVPSLYDLVVGGTLNPSSLTHSLHMIVLVKYMYFINCFGCTGTPSLFSAFYEGEQLHDSLFAFLLSAALQNGGLLLKERTCSWGEEGTLLQF